MGGPPAWGRPAKPVKCYRTTLPTEGQRNSATPPSIRCRRDLEVTRRRPLSPAISELYLNLAPLHRLDEVLRCEVIQVALWSPAKRAQAVFG